MTGKCRCFPRRAAPELGPTILSMSFIATPVLTDEASAGPSMDVPELEEVIIYARKFAFSDQSDLLIIAKLPLQWLVLCSAPLHFRARLKGPYLA